MARGSWKALSVRLDQLARNLPPPADTAVGLMAKVALLTDTVLETKNVSTKNQRLVEQLSERSLIVSRMIELYVGESRPENDMFIEFVSGFRDTIADVAALIEKFVQLRWIERLLDGGDLRLEFKDLSTRLEVLAAGYRAHLLQKMIFGGPAEHIEHPQIRDFWRRSMMNVLEAKWDYFWDQLMHDFPGTRQFLSGPSALRNKVKLQAIAIPHDVNFVGPWEINNLFQSQNSVEHIIGAVLDGDQQTLRHLAVGQQDFIKASTTEAREVQRWTGHYIQDTHRGPMNMELYFAANNTIAGGGSDGIGLFTCSGNRRGTRVHILKQYIGQHQVKYDGEIKNRIINGIWTIGPRLRGNFHLEMQSQKSVANGTGGTILQIGGGRILQIGVMQHWTGYFIQDHMKKDMNGDIIFTHTHNIYGGGRDEVGPFTWLGRFDQLGKGVKMTKQYSHHAVYYIGTIIGYSQSMGEEEPKVAIEGSWALSYNSKPEPFFLQKCTVDLDKS
ncbi:unnamed protein product [Calypogeia fissa]